MLLRRVAIAEATSFLVLLVATVVKYSDGGDGGVRVLGPIHGVLFLAYIGLVLVIRERTRWSARTTGLLALAAVLPFGGYAADRWLAHDDGEAVRGA